MIGQVVSHYKILEKLGEGGMGVVYKAQDTRLDRLVALKFLPEHLVSDPSAKPRFIQEAKGASAINHQNITTVHDIGEVDGKSFIAMEYLEGRTVKELAKGDLKLPQILEIAIQIAEGLAAAHKKEIIHRDIKSDNVKVTKDGVAKIMDFGLAKLKGAPKLTETGSTVGTAAYMSPEQTRGEEIDQRSDIFSLGVVLYELITGRLPFQGEHNAAISYSICFDNPEPLARYKSDVPGELQRIVDKALKKDRAMRYQSAADLAADLRSLKQIPKKKNRIHFYAAAAVVSVVLISTAFLLWQRGRNEKTGGAMDAQKFTKLAILPFESLRKDPETDFLGFSLADQIISKLGYIQSIVVRPSSAVQKYNPAVVELPKVARELDVEVVLTASYLKEGDRLRLNAQLVNVRKNEVVWRQVFDIHYADIFSVQDTISKRIINGLKLHISNVEASRLRRDISSSPLAYEYYLRAIAIHDATTADINVRNQLLQRSVELDSTFAPAWAALGDVYRQFSARVGNREAYFERSKKALLKALQINSELTYALDILAQDFADVGKAENAMDILKKAMQVNSRSQDLYYALGYLYRYVGSPDLSISAYGRAQEIDSSLGYLANTQNQITKACIHKGEYAVAVASAEKAVHYAKLTGQTPELSGLFYLGMAYYYSKDSSRAFQAFDSCWDIEKNNTWALFGQAYKAGAQKDKKRLVELIKKLEEREIVDVEMSYRFAHFYCFAGQPEKALKALKVSVEGGFFSYPYISTDPLLEKIHGTKEFKLILDGAKKRHEAFKQKFGEKFW